MAMSVGRVPGSPVIDSHLHVWANAATESDTFPYAPGQEPPESLREAASTAALLDAMSVHGVDGALIVQPINHGFDHAYVSRALRDHPDKFKGMLLHDPALPPAEAVSALEELVLKGFVGVRFNPYLWPERKGETGWKPMSTLGEGGLAVYKRCAELKMPVGIMCFRGLQHHYDDILALLRASPETVLILDHFGFTAFTDEGNAAFEQLLGLASHPNVVVKISALFRLGDEDGATYSRVRKERFRPLLEAYGPGRLMFGSDFPFALEQDGGYRRPAEVVSSWLGDDEEARRQVMGGTAARCFGEWGTKAPLSKD